MHVLLFVYLVYFINIKMKTSLINIITFFSDSCPEGQFHCHDNTCVKPDAGCNGIIECPDGSDEDPLSCGVQINSKFVFNVYFSGASDSPTNYRNLSRSILLSQYQFGCIDSF